MWSIISVPDFYIYFSLKNICPEECGIWEQGYMTEKKGNFSSADCILLKKNSPEMVIVLLIMITFFLLLGKKKAWDTNDFQEENSGKEEDSSFLIKSKSWPNFNVPHLCFKKKSGKTASLHLMSTCSKIQVLTMSSHRCGCHSILMIMWLHVRCLATGSQLSHCSIPSSWDHLLQPSLLVSNKQSQRGNWQEASDGNYITAGCCNHTEAT